MESLAYEIVAMAVTVFVTSEQVEAEVVAGSPAPSLLTLRAAIPLQSH